MNHTTESLQDRTVVIVTDTACNILWVSEAFTSNFRVLGPSPVGRSLVDWLSSYPDSDSLRHHIKACISAGTKLKHTIRLGSESRLKLACHPVANVEGQARSYILVGVLPHAGPQAAPSRNEGAFKAQYQGSSLTLERGRELFDRAERLVRDDQLFRDRDLSIAKLAQKLNTNTQYLSQVINFLFGDRFSTYINLARLEYAERLLSTGSYDERDIWWECGFGSYSAFYRAAHRHRGVSPSQLRRNKVARSV